MLNVVTLLINIQYELLVVWVLPFLPVMDDLVPDVLPFGWFYFIITPFLCYSIDPSPWSASTPSFGLIFQEKIRPVMLSRDKGNWGFQQRRCRSMGRGCCVNGYVTPGVWILCLLSSGSGTCTLPLQREDEGGSRGYTGWLSAFGGCRYIFTFNWMFLVCAKMNLGFLPMLVIRFFSEGDRGFGYTKSAWVGIILFMTK